jgi:Cu(I)/Ag(I) efflux system protein CusF
MKQTAILFLIFAVSASSIALVPSTNANTMAGKPASKETGSVSHHIEAVVKKVSPAASKVTLAHGPVKSLNWPAMTMSFSVSDKALFNKLAVEKKVNVEFVQKGGDYVVTAVNK